MSGPSRDYDAEKSQQQRGNGSEPPPRLNLAYGWSGLKPGALSTIVQGLLHAGSITLFYGKPKSGKSFLATDCALSVADDATDEWMGLPIKQHGPVLYVACEGHAGYWKRLQAAANQRGWDEFSFPHRFVLATGRPALLIVDAFTRVFVPHPDDILLAIETCTRTVGQPIVVFVDTVFRSFGPGNVNASDHMMAYVGALTFVTDLGIAVAAVHHENKSGGTPSGSIALTGAADTIVRVEQPKKGERRWCIEEAKDDASTGWQKFSLQVVSVGKDAEGDEASSCIVRAEGPEAEQQDGERPAPKGKVTLFRDIQLELLREIIGKEGKQINNLNGSTEYAVEVEKFRQAVYRRVSPDLSPEAKKKAFRRGIDRLESQSKIGVLDEWIWIIS